METIIIGIGMTGITAALLGLLYVRRRYFLLYQKVQQFQKTILENGKIQADTDREGAEDVIRDGFLRIQEKYEMEAEEARQDKQAVQGLISDLSHQLKTPLANIRLYQELLRNPSLSKEKREALQQRLEEQTGKLDWLLAVLFQMVDLERGVASLAVEEGPALPALTRAMETVLPRAEQKKIQFRVTEYEDRRWSDLTLLYDPRWTEEVFVNLLENAVKYSPGGSDIVLSMEVYETYGAVLIEDQGPGIPREEYSRIFQKFYRGEQAKDKEGWGIGLYLSRLILEREQGYIKVESEVGKGSTFAVFLPQVLTKL